MAASTITKVTVFLTCEGVPVPSSHKKLCVSLQELNGGGQVIANTTTLPHDFEIQGSSKLIFHTPLSVEYFFETRQFMRVLVHEHGQQDHPISHATFQMSHVMTSRDLIKIVSLSYPAGATMTITAVDHSLTREDLCTIKFRAEGFEDGCFSKPNPFFVLFRVMSTGHRVPIHKSDVSKSTCDPTWVGTPSIRLAEMIGRDLNEKTLDLRCYDSGVFGDSELGHVMLSLNDLITASGQIPKVKFPLRSGNTVVAGHLTVESCVIQHAMTFVNLLSSGWQINMVAAVDFTASNGDPRDHRSLHHMNVETPNEYIRTIRSVGDIVMEYDSDKMVAGFGFGAELPDKRTSHFFHLNMQADPYVHQIDGLIAAYLNALSVVKLSGPTYFAPTIRNVLNGVRQAEKDHVYTILVIMTDGDICDMDDTIDTLVDADDAALSIIIVGVGKECDFRAMVQLDGDDAALVSRKGRKSRRDLVQFVPMREWSHLPPHRFAVEVLREVPSQVERWAAITGITAEAV
jgi:hypothetical protein